MARADTCEIDNPQSLNTFRQIALMNSSAVNFASCGTGTHPSSNCLLEGCARCASYLYFAIEQGNGCQSERNLVYPVLDQPAVDGACHCPDDVCCRVADARPNCLDSQFAIVDKSLLSVVSKV